MAALPFLLFPAVLILAGALAISYRRERRPLAKAHVALASVSALLVANEVVQYSMLSNIRVDLLLTMPALAVAALVLGGISLTSGTGPARGLALTLTAVGGVALAWYGLVFARTSLDAARQTQQFFAGNRLYWEETIRCGQSMSSRFGSLQRDGDPCYGNLRVTSRSGPYPFTRLVVNNRREMFLMFSPESGVETVFGMEESWPISGSETAHGLRAEGTGASGKLVIDLRRNAGSCQATVTQERSAENILRLWREDVPPCPVEQNSPVQPVGVWSTVKPLGTEHMRLVQVWLWRSNDKAWAMLMQTDGVRGQERRFNFLKRFQGNAVSPGRYQLEPYSSLDGQGPLAVELQGGKARVEWSQGTRNAFMLEPGAQVSHPKIRLAPGRDTQRFAAYFDSVLRLVDIPWTPPL